MPKIIVFPRTLIMFHLRNKLKILHMKKEKVNI